MRLGEALVASGHITESQLEKALAAQLIYGGHLGTCLIELGYVDEETLGGLLSRVYDVSYARRELLDDIQRPVLAALSQESVEKHMTIPFNLVKRTLQVAMVNPGHVPSLDELYFVSGYRIEPWVSPEVRIFQAMERYYQVPRRTRYIALARSLDEKKPAERTAKRRKTLEAGMSVAAAGTAEPVVTLPPLVSIASDREGGEIAPRAARPAATHQPAAGQNGLEARLARAAEDLCRAEEAGLAVKIAMDFVAQDAARCVLFGVKGSEAFIKDVRGLVVDAVTAHRIRFAVTTEPLLTLLSGEQYYRGPATDPKHAPFFDSLKIEPPKEILLLPIHRHDRLAALLYADGGAQAAIRGETEGFLRVMRKLTLALDLVEVKQRVRSS